jgi:arylsulfatase A
MKRSSGPGEFMLMKIMLFVAMLLSAQATAADRPPNIVMILADDLGWGDVSFNGRTEWATPNLDQLAKEGTCYKRWYTAAVVCAPSRAALMTGRYSIHNGVTGNSSLDLPSEEVTIAEALKGHGYTTALFGKWHHGAPRPGKKDYTHPMDQGFDEFFGYTDAKAAWQKFPGELFDGRQEKPAKGYADTLFANHAVDFIGRQKEQPFFLYLAFIAPHGLQEAPEEEISVHLATFKDTDDAKARICAIYAAQVTQLDKEVGRVMKAIKDAEMDENTLVVFSSDHGATFEVMQKGATAALDSNKPFRGQKRTLWEGGARVPGIVRWPGRVKAGETSEELVHMLDLFPTFCDVAGMTVDPKWKVDGVDLLKVFEGKAKSPERTIFWEWDESGNKQLAAMRGNLKCITSGGNQPELYDVVLDPAERIDRHAVFPKEAKALEKAMNDWYATMSDAAKQKKKSKDEKVAADGHSTKDE